MVNSQWLKVQRSGFTLVEMLIALSILFVVGGVGFLIVPGIYRAQVVASERDTVVEVLERARAKALGNVRQSDHGLFIDSEEYVLFEGSSYAARDVRYDEAFSREDGFVFGGLSEIVFRALDAYVATSGQITITNGPALFVIEVNEEGALYW